MIHGLRALNNGDDKMTEKVKIHDLVTQMEQLATQMEEWSDTARDKPPAPAELAKLFFQMKQGHEALDKARKRVYKVVDMVDKFLMPKVLQDNNMDMIRIPELERSFGLRNQMSASIIDKEAGMKWLKDNGHADLIQPTVNASTLASFAKTLMVDEGIDLPDDIFKVTQYQRTGINKYTPK